MNDIFTDIFEQLSACNWGFFQNPQIGENSSYAASIEQHYQQLLSDFVREKYAVEWSVDPACQIPHHAEICDALDAARSEFNAWLADYGEHAEQIREIRLIDLVRFPFGGLIRFNLETHSGQRHEIYTNLNLGATDSSEAIWIRRIIAMLTLDLILRIQQLIRPKDFHETDPLVF